MRFWIATSVLLLSVAPLRADDKVADVQQILKDQGFYYGAINGQKDTDTSAAIRRYQIRNGLQITGDLNDETLKSLHSAPAATPAPVAPSTPNRAIVQATPPPAPPDTSDLRDDSVREPDAPAPTNRFMVPDDNNRQPQQPPIYNGRIVPAPAANGNFVGTPFETAPPDMQRDVIAQAQKKLAKRDLFKGEIDGVFSPDLEFSLRAYQSRVGLTRTGRLDSQTLAALELLPGAHEPIYAPRRPMRLPPGVEPPVRGEWVRP